MTLEFAVDESPSSFGNHFIVGLSGLELNDSDKRVLSTVRPAGILFLKRNLDHEAPYPEWVWKLSRLIEEVKHYTEREKLLLTIDHEGERVTRTPPPLTIFPNAIHVGPHAAEMASAQATELRSIGVNVSWAPCTDIHSNPANPVIGERAFGTTADEVIGATVPYLRALTEGGILGCGKHFPGHGDTSTDSHYELPVVDLTEAAILERELRPFQALIDLDVPFMMTAHILYPRIDSAYPATMSERIINGILRQKMGYKRVIITDDLDMRAVSEQFNDGSMLARALNVGCDMFIVARHPGKAEDRPIAMAKDIAASLARREVSEDTMFQAFSRINGVFDELLQDHEPHVLDEATLRKHRELAKRIKSGSP